MKKISYSLPVKVLASFMFVILTILTLSGAVGIAYMSEEKYYEGNEPDFTESGIINDLLFNDAYGAYNNYYFWFRQQDTEPNKQYYFDKYQREYSTKETNFRFRISDETGTELLTNCDDADEITSDAKNMIFLEFLVGGEENVTIREYGYNSYYLEEGTLYLDGEPYIFNVTDMKTYTVFYDVKDPVTVNDEYSLPYQLYQIMYSLRYWIIPITLIAMILDIISFVYLMCAAGHRRNSDVLKPNPQDKIPFDFYLGAMVGLGVLFSYLVVELVSTFNAIPAIGMIVLVYAALMLVLVLATFMTMASRVKMGSLFRNTIIFFCLHLTWRMTKAIFRGIKNFIEKIPITWKSIVAFVSLAFINLILIFIIFEGRAYIALIPWFLFHVIVLIIICIVTAQFDGLYKGSGKIAAGDTEYKISTINLFSNFKKLAENLNSIGDGITKAVDERMKSEHLKTELITNVSHDIKTPLTSIINYVDLLKKEDIANENAHEYIAVLDRQSARLKKLTEDLVEASKASTGNIAVALGPVDVVELLNQSVGEYSERLADNQLYPVINAPKDGAVIFADGKLLWRVFDNLLSNICKYSQNNTRVYFDIMSAGSQISIAVKNISKDVLNITADELMERFVRGDSSRTTEGSGLGLSIARSLTELQRGTFNLFVDGDLFKAVVTFHKA